MYDLVKKINRIYEIVLFFITVLLLQLWRQQNQ